MTKEEASNLKSFRHTCTCGGYAYSVNGRSKSNPHLDYCKQKPEYDEWYKALNTD